MRDKIDKLDYLILYEKKLTGQYSDFNGTHNIYSDEETTSISPPNNEEIMNKINEIIDILNEESEQE